ncbi:hypothetical protein ACRS52_16360 [Bacillus cytotoxicus]|uniref:Uncharacterized protein n=1 Tax=Bacillus cytotoxicus TaxID=580165 RepID=A0AAX2CFE4_9BACI|nr:MULTISPECIES: hypothetical protein [Bacillus cereus group]MDH2880557.1 hypothetical protein [Bacillus cytotoxicus]QTR77634.1 hypothetical protein JC773_13785 [Bacillus cytotoxicus]QTR82547.1 hypothetical protein JC777_18965 [Bacillus cytotoxicus]QTR86285.1 hypothetical protein JC774_17470 [Bacillus cytotoxicus]SCL89708.1 Uncharacterized protein BCB44BAC_01589 [Bacillus cytotoxicus]
MIEKTLLLGEPLTIIRFEILDMIQKANRQTSSVLEAFNELNEHEYENKTLAMNDVNLNLVFIHNNNLFVKVYNKKEVKVFKNLMFNDLNEDKQYIMFIDNMNNDYLALIKKISRSLQLKFKQNNIKVNRIQSLEDQIIGDSLKTSLVIEGEFGYERTR